MPSETTSPFAAFPDAIVARAQHGLACVCKAWTQFTMGMMAGGMAEMNLAREFWATAPTDWKPMLHRTSAHNAAQEWLHEMRGKYQLTLQAQRQVNNEFANAWFGAMETMIEALPPTVSVPSEGSLFQQTSVTVSKAA